MDNDGFFELSKYDVLKRELEFSIRLVFLSGDPVVQHVVATSAQNIATDLCRLKGIPTQIDDLLKSVREDMKKIVINKLHKPQNFFKHADKDADELLRFNPESTEFALWETINLYQKLTGEITGLMMAMRAYFILKNKEMFMVDENYINIINSFKDLDVNDKPKFLKLGSDAETHRVPS